jgi:hypothetical protein
MNHHLKQEILFNYKIQGSKHGIQMHIVDKKMLKVLEDY